MSSSRDATLAPDHFRRRAKEHLDRIYRIEEMFGQKVAIDQIREAAKELKEEIRIDMEWGSARTRSEGLSVDERSAVAAIWQAGCHLRFKWNSTPSSRWFEQLDEAETELADYR